jgi:hypothetical protein
MSSFEEWELKEVGEHALKWDCEYDHKWTKHTWLAAYRAGQEEMREQTALCYGFMDERHIRKGKAHVQSIFRALPLEGDDE